MTLFKARCRNFFESKMAEYDYSATELPTTWKGITTEIALHNKNTFTFY